MIRLLSCKLIGTLLLNFVGPPDAVKNVSVENITSFSVDISWGSPDPGSAKLGTYIITCITCPKDRKEFPVNTTKNQITINNLGAYAYYQINIVNVNSITTITGKNVSVTENFTTSEGGNCGPVYFIFDFLINLFHTTDPSL